MTRAVCAWVGLAWMVAAAAGCGGDDAPPAPDTGPGPSGDTGVMDARPGEDGGPGECTDDGACDDGLFCNGVETCDPGSPSADARGCVADDAFDCDDDVVCTVDVCSEEMRRCTHTPPDGDGDGHGDAACV